MSLYRKATLGGIVILGVGLAFLLRGLGIEVGTGSGDGTSKESSQHQSAEETGMMADMAQDKPLIPLTPRPAENSTLPDTGRLITVIVTGDGYLWGTNDTQTRSVKPIELTEIVDKARATSGDPQGIRARVYHVGSALPSTENQLIAALKEAGLSETEIFFEQRVIELPQD